MSIMVGRPYGEWPVIGVAGRRPGGMYYRCRCSCGVERDVQANHLYSGRSRSCGHRKRFGAHGHSDSITYSSWRSMKDRCLCPTSECYAEYGGRGITVCDRWKDDFLTFMADMGPRPSRRHSLDRYPDQNGNYEPGNCRWATSTQQMRNTRYNRIVTAFGEEMCVSALAERLGVSALKVFCRLNGGWTPDDVVAYYTTGEKPKHTIGETILRFLGQYPAGLRGKEIRRQLEAVVPTSKANKRDSISTTLWLLRRDGKVIRTPDRRYQLAPQG